MSFSNEQTGIKRELPDDDDDESKSTVQLGTASSSSFLYQPVKQEQFDECKSKSILQSGATFYFDRPVKLENVQVKLEEAASPVSHVFGHMAKCTLGNQCTTPNCSTLKAMAKHWLCCASAHCSVCGPFQPKSRNPLPQISAQPIPVSQIHVPSLNIAQSGISRPPVSGLQSSSTITQANQSTNNNPQARPQFLNSLKSFNVPQDLFTKLSEEPKVRTQLSVRKEVATQGGAILNRQGHDQITRLLQEQRELVEENAQLLQEKQMLKLRLKQLKLQHNQSSINQSHNPLSQATRQSIPGSQANVPTPNIAQPNTSQPQVSGLQPYATMTPTQALQQQQ